MQQHARIGDKTPVVVLARAVDTVERLLMEQHPEAVFVGHLLHQAHQQHVVVDRQVAFLVDGSQLKLPRRHLVVARLAGNAQLQGLRLQVFHEGLDAFRDGAEVVVVHLLVLGRVVPHERPSRQHEVGTRRVEAFVHQEVLLFPAQVGLHLLHFPVEITADGRSRLADGMQRFQQRGLVVERFARVGDEDGGYAERVVDDEDGRCGVPGRVAAGLEGVANAAVGEA